MVYYAGVDIGGTNVRIVICNDEKLLIKITESTVKSGDITALPNQVINLLDRGLSELSLDKNILKGIGTSSAGPFVRKESIFCPNISGEINGNDWGPIPYIPELRKRFGDNIPYELANDCVSSVKAENLFGAGKGYDNCVYITISTGVGGGIIADGHLLQGKGNNAAHFGHVIIDVAGSQACGCGQRGCAESMISGRSIARRACQLGFTADVGVEVDAKVVFDAFRKGNNPYANIVVNETVRYIAQFFSTVINTTDTECLVVGGGVFYHNRDCLLEPVKAVLHKNCYHPIADDVKIVLSELGDYVGDMAGLALVLPDDIIKKWQSSRPWEKGAEKTIKL